jgi:flagellar protein FlbT
VIGGASVKNVGGKTTTVLIENEVPVLREKEIMSERDADTPCKKVYFLAQLMYLDGKNVEKYHKLYWKLAKEIIGAAPSTLGLFEKISEQLYNERYYQALKDIRTLIQYEEKAIAHALKPNRRV